MAGKLSTAVLEAVQTALYTIAGGTPAAEPPIDDALAAMCAGDAAALRGALSRLPAATTDPPIDIAAVHRGLDAITAFLSELDGAAPPDVLVQRRDALVALARALGTLAQGYSAFVLCEVAYVLSDGLGVDALDVTRLQLSLASPNNTAEFHLRAWRCAIEACRRALSTGADWLTAIDAVELALALPLPDLIQQAQTLKELHGLLWQTSKTPLEALLLAYWCQAPISAFDREELRQRIVKYLTAIDALPAQIGPDVGAGAELQPLREAAATFSQPHVDDARMALQASQHFAPEINWSDHTLNHVRYVDAVPLRRSLLVDVDRTGETTMELVHELTHAYTLLGPLGWARTAYRTAIQYLEMLLQDHVPGAKPAASAQSMHSRPALAALSALPGPSLVPLLCDAQMAALLRSKTLQAVWLPWLEGLAVYVELMCDPLEDSHYILTPHAALRSLVDLHGERPEHESVDTWRQRLDQDLVDQFESFYGAALKRYARWRHLGYLRAQSMPQVYLLGYLIVRSIVSRWELALGTRIAPVEAARLLLDATRNGTAPALPPLASGIDEFEPRCRKGLQQFLDDLAALPPETLRGYFAPPQDKTIRRYVWVDGVPVIAGVAVGGAPDDSRLLQVHEALRRDSVAVALRGGPLAVAQISDDDFAVASSRHAPQITQVYDWLHAQSSLVAVGRCQARVIVLDESLGRVALCPRTYAGLGTATATGDLAKARYSIRVINLAGGAAELKRLQAQLRRHRSARVLCTRLIDMVGLADSPFAAQNTSYVYFGLGDWSLVSTNDSMRPIDPKFDPFASLLKFRVDPPALMRGEHQTLDNPAFLTARLQGELAKVPSAARLAAFDFERLAQDSAAALAGRAFAVAPGTASRATEELIGERAQHGALADLLTGNGAPPAIARALATPLGQIALDADAFSRVRAYPPRTHGDVV